MTRSRALVVSTFLTMVVAAACGGSGSSNSGGGSNGGGNTGGGGTTTTNPCNTALLADTAEVGAVGSVLQSGYPPPDKKTIIDGDPRGRAYEAIALHKDAVERRSGQARAAAVTDAGVESRRENALTSPSPVAEDIGDIAVIQDTGDLILPQNTYDLRSTGLRFTRNGSSYTLSHIDGNFRASLGNRVTLGDDDSAGVAIPFSFPFYGNATTAAFVNSDGNITFGEEDHSSTDRNVARLLVGPPRVAPFFADLDPSQSVGKVFVNAASDQYTVTWCGVRGFDSQRTVTTQATLFPDGSVEMKYGDSINLTDSVVALSPGHTGDFTTVDLTTSTASAAGAIGERFASQVTLDNVAVSQKFYQTHGDAFDQVLIWTDQPLIRDAFAFEINVANEVRGIGQDIFDLSNAFGSGGRLRSLVVMDWLGKYPDDPTQKFLGENNTLSVLGQEVGHRWLAYIDFRDHTGARSDALLGRDLAHWSFFFDSDASVMEGNDIQDQGGGQFQTVDAVRRYSRLDQYMMGLVPPTLVPTFFYVENPGSSHQRADAPQINVSFTGTRRDVLIDDVVAINGPRVPAAADAPHSFRQAFIYVVSNGRSLDQGQVAKLDRIRSQWEAFFGGPATENRMGANTHLR